ncbi:MAG: TPM domain-containing protein, partial [Muribaculaceae bacterium]|nr:TPM domain-containing protein [Muribaculaceae bacterium]
MRSILFTLVAFLSVATAFGRDVNEVPNVHLADSTRFVSDPDGYLSQGAIARADSVLRATWRSSTAEPVMVVVSDIGDNNIDDYATDLFDAWGIGKKDTDNGLLVVISVNDRKAVLRT